MASHWNVNCDGCGTRNLVHYRYKCLRCEDYDLCSGCHENKVETGDHKNSHPFQCLLDRAARELFFAGEPIPELSAESFTCPICGEMGHTRRDLIKHVQDNHNGDSTAVICPLCVTLATAHPEWVINITSHLIMQHGDGILRMGGHYNGGGVGGYGAGSSGADGSGLDADGAYNLSLNPAGRGHLSNYNGNGDNGGNGNNGNGDGNGDGNGGAIGDVDNPTFHYRAMSSPSILRTHGSPHIDNPDMMAVGGGHFNAGGSNRRSGNTSNPHIHHVQILDGPQSELSDQLVHLSLTPPHAESEDLSDSDMYDDSD